MAKSKYAPVLSEEYPDCLTCTHGSRAEYSLIDCDTRSSNIPHPNCTEWRVPCVNYDKRKKKDEEETI
jgi:hypothetical protein